MRVITWNLGGMTFKGSSARAWQQLLAWDPDVALVQETYRPEHLSSELWSFTSYAGIPDRGTLVYSKAGLTPRPTDGRFHTAVEGQVTLADVKQGNAVMLFASVHAIVDPVNGNLLEGLDTTGVSSWGGKLVRPLDLILADVSQATRGSRFVVGGDFNASMRFDRLAGARGSSFTKWFLKARDAQWRAAHPKFHAGDQRTLFRPGRDEPYQIDHLFTDDRTWNALTSCDVVTVPYLNEFTDHAPLALEW